MSTFVIIPTVQSAEQKTSLDDYLLKRFANAAYQLPSGEWFVAYDGTSRQLADDTGISEGTFGSAIVLHTSGYWGRADKSTWEWLAANEK